MMYFCNEIFPLIVAKVQGVRLTIIGSSVTQAIKDLERDGVQVIGFVPDVEPYLDSSYVSIAPLRYGGGMKRKIGDAMAHGLPVVTTSIGIEGFGLTPFANVLVGDTPQDFAKMTCDLLREASLYERIRRSGWSFMKERFSQQAVAERVDAIFSHLTDFPEKHLGIGSYLRRAVPQQLHRHLLWRFREPARNKAGRS
jgi:glycosyltransferase involved in cell wall biosynthesis